MRQHSKNSSKELMSSSHDSLFIRQSLFSSFKEICLKQGINPYNTDCHDVDKSDVDKSSEVAVTSFRDSAFTLKLTRLKHSRVYPGKGNKAFMRWKIKDISYSARKEAPVVVSIPSIEVITSSSSIIIE